MEARLFEHVTIVLASCGLSNASEIARAQLQAEVRRSRAKLVPSRWELGATKEDPLQRVAILFPRRQEPAAPALLIVDASAQPGVKARATSLPVMASVRAFRLDPRLSAGRGTARAGCGSAPGWSSLPNFTFQLMSKTPSFAERREHVAAMAADIARMATTLTGYAADLEFEAAQMAAAEKRFVERRRGGGKRERS